MQGPETYLNDLGIQLACAVDSTRSAVLDAEHRVFLNYETYYVSTVEARDRFLAAPWQYSGRITDPVSRERFEPGSGSARREHAGRVFLFASAENVATFDASPDDYATPMIGMVAAQP